MSRAFSYQAVSRAPTLRQVVACLFLVTLGLNALGTPPPPGPDFARGALEAVDSPALRLFARGRGHESNFEFEAARASYESAVRQIEAERGNFDAALIEPLVGLGRVLLRLGMIDAAEASFRRGQHVVHRSEGVHALRQLEVIERLVEVHLARGDHLAADQQQRFSLFIAEHNFGPQHPGLAPALNRLAEWYEDTGQFRNARKTRERLVDIIRDNGTATDLDLIDPLLAIIESERLAGTCCSSAEQSAVRHILDTSHDISPARKAEALLKLADNLNARSKSNRAARLYNEAWALLDEKAHEQAFAQPTQLPMHKMLDDALDENVVSGRELTRMGTRRLSSIMRTNPMSLGRQVRGERLGERDGLQFEDAPPQFFLVPGRTQPLPARIRDQRYERSVGEELTIAVIGEPFQFVKSQLAYILPRRFLAEEAMASLVVQMEFTVDESGQVDDVEIVSSNAPAPLNRVMRKVMKKSRYRPRMVDGVALAAERVQLQQTFAISSAAATVADRGTAAAGTRH